MENSSLENGPKRWDEGGGENGMQKVGGTRGRGHSECIVDASRTSIFMQRYSRASAQYTYANAAQTNTSMKMTIMMLMLVSVALMIVDTTVLMPGMNFSVRSGRRRRRMRRIDGENSALLTPIKRWGGVDHTMREFERGEGKDREKK